MLRPPGPLADRVRDISAAAPRQDAHRVEAPKVGPRFVNCSPSRAFVDQVSVSDAVSLPLLQQIPGMMVCEWRFGLDVGVAPARDFNGALPLFVASPGPTRPSTPVSAA